MATDRRAICVERLWGFVLAGKNSCFEAGLPVGASLYLKNKTRSFDQGPPMFDKPNHTPYRPYTMSTNPSFPAQNIENFKIVKKGSVIQDVDHLLKIAATKAIKSLPRLHLEQPSLKMSPQNNRQLQQGHLEITNLGGVACRAEVCDASSVKCELPCD